jgi:hypothetical protein
MGFPGYSVNPLGQVRNDASEWLLIPRFNQYGVPYVGLMRRDDKTNEQFTRSLPRLVALAFLDPPPETWTSPTPVQMDGDPQNCRADNLVWRPRWYAVHYKHQFKVERYNAPIEAPVRSLSDGNIFPDSLAAGCFYGLLEREVVLSVVKKTPTWPTYQFFELAEVA